MRASRDGIVLDGVLSVSRVPVDTSCPNSLYTELASKLYLYMALAIPILNGDLAHNVYGVTLFPTMIGYG